MVYLNEEGESRARAKVAPKTTLSVIDRNIRKILRIMMFRKRQDSAKPYYQNLDNLALASNIKILQSKFMKKLIVGEQPKPIKCIIH